MSFPPGFLPEPEREAPEPQPGVAAPPAFAPHEPQLVSSRVAVFPAWSGWDAIAVLLVTVLAVFGFSVAALAVAHVFPAYRHLAIAELATNAKVIVGSQAAAYPVVIVFMVGLVRARSAQPFAKAIQWRWPGNTAATFIFLGILLAFVTESLSRFLPIPKSLPMDRYFNEASSAYLMAIFGITLAPLLEELFFRGMLYPLFRRRLGITMAVALTSAAFASIHGAQLGYAWGPIVSIFFVGVAFTAVRQRTSSVASSFLMHVGYNLTLFTMLWIASDHYRHLEKVAG